MANTESTDDGTERSQNAPRKVIRIAAADGRIHEREAVRLFTIAADCHRRGDLKGAVGGYTQALLLNPSFPDPYNNLGVALRAMGRYEAAVACYRRSLGIRPGNAGLYCNLGNALRDLDRYVEAAAAHKMAVELAPDMPDAIYNLGLVLRDLGQMNDALAWFERALKRNPDHVECRWDRALTLLQMGDFEKGFPEYEWRWRLSATPKRTFDQPRWDGSDLAGRTILLHQEQGLGDMIQFIRYAPLVKALGGTVLVECQPELARLFSTARGVDKIVIKDNRLPPFDIYAPLLSLPGILGTTLETVPAKVPYLAGPELHNLHLPIPVGSRLNVGIVWAGKVTHANDRRRSCPVRASHRPHGPSGGHVLQPAKEARRPATWRATPARRWSWTWATSCRTSPIPPSCSPNSTWSSPSIPRWCIWRGPWGARPGCCSPSPATGDGSTAAGTTPGILPCARSARKARATGRAS